MQLLQDHAANYAFDLDSASPVAGKSARQILCDLLSVQLNKALEKADLTATGKILDVPRRLSGLVSLKYWHCSYRDVDRCCSWKS